MKGAHDRIIADAEQQKTSPAISKPNITGWKLNGHYLIVNWNHSDVNKQVHGYYVLLCRVVDSQCTGPDFINFGANIKSGRIIGLAPETTYQVEVYNYYCECEVIHYNIFTSHYWPSKCLCYYYYRSLHIVQRNMYLVIQ